MNCNHCHAPVEPGSNFCTNCGAPCAAEPTQETAGKTKLSGKKKWIIPVVAAMVVAATVIGCAAKNNGSTNAPEAPSAVPETVQSSAAAEETVPAEDSTDRDADVEVYFPEAVREGVLCPTCQGEGKCTCPACGGDGSLTVSVHVPDYGNGSESYTKTGQCYACRGTGEMTCFHCLGTGYLR